MAPHSETHPQSAPEAEPEAVVTVEIDATPQDVWHAITSEEGLAGWMGDGSSVGHSQGEEVVMNDVASGEARRGVLDEVSPDHRLGYTWWPETDPARATRVSITLTPCVSGTRVTVVETLPRSAQPMASAGRAIGAAAFSTWQWRAALLSLTCVLVGARG